MPPFEMQVSPPASRPRSSVMWTDCTPAGQLANPLTLAVALNPDPLGTTWLRHLASGWIVLMDKMHTAVGIADRKITELSEPRPYFGYQVSVQSYPRIPYALCERTCVEVFQFLPSPCGERNRKET